MNYMAFMAIQELKLELEWMDDDDDDDGCAFNLYKFYSFSSLLSWGIFNDSGVMGILYSIFITELISYNLEIKKKNQ